MNEVLVSMRSSGGLSDLFCKSYAVNQKAAAAGIPGQNQEPW